MAATFLCVSRLPNTIASGLPAKISITACGATGELDQNWNGDVEVNFLLHLHRTSLCPPYEYIHAVHTSNRSSGTVPSPGALLPSLLEEAFK